jgi:flagellar biosynthetic protein FlhB
MSEDRTQPASKRRRQLAREQGQAAHSPELTAAAGWLVALLVLAYIGVGLGRDLVGLTRDAFSPGSSVWLDSPALVGLLRALAFRLAFPLGTVLLGFAAGAILAHQLQVRGLWAVGLIAPDPSRLWSPGRGGGLAAGFERIAWSVLKAAILVSVAFWSIRSGWVAIQRLGALEFPALAGAACEALLRPATVLAVALVVVGLADYALRLARFEAMLCTTPDEQREDQRIMEGDLSLRAKRRRLARAWRGDAPEFLAGASLLVYGANGLTVILAGGPPPRRVSVRNAAEGKTGLQLRRSNRSVRLPELDDPDLAHLLAGQATAATAGPQPLPARLMADLARAWPAS